MIGKRKQRLRRFAAVCGLLAAALLLLAAAAYGGQAGSAAGQPASSAFLQSLTEQERAWLNDHPVIRVVQDPGWPPIEFTDERGDPSGMARDYLNIIEQRLGVRFERVRNLSWQEAYGRLKRWEIDMTTSVAVTPDRVAFWAFTDPYMRIPIVIVAHADVTYIADMRELAGKRVAVVDGYAASDWIPRDFPGIELVRVKTVQEALETLQRGEVFACVENMLVVGYYMAKLKMTTLKVAGETPYANAQCMAVRKDWAILAGMVQKALDSISEPERNEIYRKWLPVRYEHGFDYTPLWQALALFAVILAGLLFWIRRLAAEVNDRKHAEEASRGSEKRFRQLFNVAPLPLCLVDSEGVLQDVNDRFVQIFGYTRLDVPTIAEWWELAYPDPDYRRWVVATWDAAVRRARETHADIEPVEYRVTCKSGDVRTMMISGTILGDDFLAAFFDVTDRKRSEEEMLILAEIGQVIGSTLEIDEVCRRMVAEIGKRIPFDSLMVNLIDSRQETLTVAYVCGLDMPGRAVGESYPVRGTIMGEIVGTRRGMIVQSANPDELVGRFPSSAVSVRAGMRSIMVIPLIARDRLIGNLILRSKTPVAYVENDLRLAEKIGMQIAWAIANAQLYRELSEAERSLRESEGRFRSLFEQAAVGVAEVERVTGRHCSVNRRFCEMVGRTEEELLAATYQEITHPQDLHLHEEKAALLLAGEISHYSQEKRYLRKDGGTLWVNITVSPLWKPGEDPGYSMTVIEDITERKKAEAQLQHTLENLRAAVNTTIQVMVAAVEARDPYTSGHQVRSADLARAVAVEMGMPQESIDAIRMAGSIHDIGKLSIPAEILSKPTKLSEIEFALIKEHAKKGYEMLKDVESPWPLAEIVRQHHERIDGSGYPRGLQGEEILPEARILAVADVVEAMASHRPYRPGLGIAVALNEIEKNRGVYYDGAAVDACLRLFREKGFQLQA